ncbi:MAG: ParB/RepB/Spo0J family partition protein [Lachnospiraceae bacterium]
MAIKRGGLGKGLDSLIPDNKNTKTVEKVGTSTKQEHDLKDENKSEELSGMGEQVVKINKVEPNREQPRRTFEEDTLLELADSIRQFGILQPLLVQKRKDYYEIIAGERRWRAAKLAGLKEIPVMIRDYTEQEVVEISLIENIQRENLNPIEEAMAFKKLLTEFSLKQDEVAERVSKSRTAVTNSMRLLKLNDKVQQMIVDDMISTGHARALLALDDEKQQYLLATQIFDEKLSVRETEKLIRNLKNPKKVQEKKIIEDDFIYKDIEEKLKTRIGTKVYVSQKSKGKGKIEIEYYSEEELERIFDLIMTIREEV